MAAKAARPRAGESRLARLVTEVLSPFHVVIPLPAAVGWHQSHPAATGLLWGLFAAVAGAVSILTAEFGAWAWACWPLVALAGWSRIALRDHTPAQVVAGAVAGTAVCWPVYALIG
ncbi:phosphatase PAP2 family protein [Microtetraspora malaysiensis]|uniref:phosphatase PAP2 family protein n=1 Tax=Microtetraspora malaysiensis TaxID=161358 RepID=UPI003D8A4B38